MLLVHVKAHTLPVVLINTYDQDLTIRKHLGRQSYVKCPSNHNDEELNFSDDEHMGDQDLGKKLLQIVEPNGEGSPSARNSHDCIGDHEHPEKPVDSVHSFVILMACRLSPYNLNVAARKEVQRSYTNEK